MKLLIVGLGSMGKRRARLTKGIDAAIQIIGVDTAESRRAEAQSLGLADAAYPTIQDAVTAAHPDAALVCTAPLSHGAIIGELLDLDKRMRSLGDWVQAKTAHLALGGQSASVSEGFVTASLLFCVGAMAIVGALNDGLTGDHSTLFAKSLLDGISSIVYGASLGIGVAFSAAAVFLYQGLIALAASFLEPFLVDSVIAEMTCVGSLLIVALGLNMLDLTKIKVMNLVPAIFLPILLCLFM